MKKIFTVLLLILMCFSFCSCSGSGSAEETTTDASLNYPPILGVHIRSGDFAGFYALTKSGSYSWTSPDGEKILADGIFCLDNDSVCTFNRKDAGDSIELRFTGDVISYKIYSAEKSSIDSGTRSDIINEKYFVSENTPEITFPETGEYYYVVDVKYAQGEIAYGFIIE